MAAISSRVVIDQGDWRAPEVNTKLGQGSFGTVYAARSRRGSLLAVKVAYAEPEIEAITREYRILSGPLKGAPGTIEVRDLYGSALKVAMLMNRLPGPNLWCTIKARPQIFTFPVLCDIARQGFDALAHYKQKCLVHSDIKPTNCSYHEGRLTFFDFGISFFPPEEKWHNGSIAYRPPETLCRESSYGGDTWAFGATLFALYTGQAMFLDIKGKECSTVRDLVWAFDAQLGESFICYLGRLCLKEQAKSYNDGVSEWSKDDCFNAGENYLQDLFTKRELTEGTSVPWCEVLSSAAECRGEISYMPWMLQFFRRIFAVPQEGRITPEEGLALLASLQSERAFQDSLLREGLLRGAEAPSAAAAQEGSPFGTQESRSGLGEQARSLHSDRSISLPNFSSQEDEKVIADLAQRMFELGAFE